VKKDKDTHNLHKVKPSERTVTMTNPTPVPIPLTAEILADRIEQIVHDLGGSASHGELLNRLADVDTQGDCCFGIDALNLICFVGLSELLANALTLLMTSKRLGMRATEFLVLLFDGCPIPCDMPLMKRRPPRGGYKKPHFSPCLVCTPEQMDAACERRRKRRR
jgi:hypothetical protein